MTVPVRFEIRDALAVITIDDATTRNALGPEAAALITSFALEAAATESVRLLMLTGADGVFCSGAAIREWEALDETGETLTDRGTELCDLLEELPLLVVACLPGHAVGGGAELALAADWRIVAPDAELRFVHAGFGLMPGFGGLVRLELLVGRPKTLEYLATRAQVGADEALAAGLVDAIVAADQQLAWAEQRAADMAGSDRAALAAIKLASATGDERAAFLDIWPARQLPDRLGS